MYKDYSLGCVGTIGKNRNRKHKKKTLSAAKEFFPAIKLIWHAFGIMLLISLVIGVTSTVWYGWQVQSALDDIGQATSVKKNMLRVPFFYQKIMVSVTTFAINSVPQWV